jgi:hypothetical protein
MESTERDGPLYAILAGALALVLALVTVFGLMSQARAGATPGDQQPELLVAGRGDPRGPRSLAVHLQREQPDQDHVADHRPSWGPGCVRPHLHRGRAGHRQEGSVRPVPHDQQLDSDWGSLPEVPAAGDYDYDHDPA